jgi:hypothetical protein
VRLLAYGALALCLIPFCSLRAQTPAANDLKAKVDDLKGKIFDARMVQRTFASGLKFCNELDGTNFYFSPRNRVLNLEEYHRSLESLATAQAYNPQTRRPWTSQDANDRWEQVKKQALSDSQNCTLAASLPELENRLQELQQSTAAEKSEKKE